MTEFLTVGHSNLEVEDFLDELHSAQVHTVVDVRKLAGSRRYPQFNAGALEASLADAGMDYTRIQALTGRRPVSHTVPFETNAWWENRSFHNYADHALSEAFRDGLTQLRELQQDRVAIMCSEAVWWRCHRRIIADHLLAHGETVLHLMSRRESPAALDKGAVVHPDGSVTYPRTTPGPETGTT